MNEEMIQVIMYVKVPLNDNLLHKYGEKELIKKNETV